eukprot:scaffold131812_cov54-Phaeocystis_antarctica.AAC.1
MPGGAHRQAHRQMGFLALTFDTWLVWSAVDGLLGGRETQGTLQLEHHCLLGSLRPTHEI